MKLKTNIIQGPQSNEPQRIGQLAISALHSQKPVLWYLGEKGGDDYGVDYEALVFASLQDGGQFYIQIQLKGTTQAKHISTDGSFISHEFNKRTLELWNNSAFVVLVIIVDLTETEDPSRAPIYYEFVNETLDELLPKIPENQKGITLRIPTANRLQNNLDIIPIVGPYLESIKESKAALRRLKDPISSSPTVSFATKIGSNESILFSMVQDNSDIKSVIEISPHAEQYRLHLNNLRNGNYASVIKAIKSPTISEIESDPTDAGLRAYLLAKAYDETADKEQAHVLMKLASRLIANNDEILAGTYQHQLENIKLGKEGESGRQALLEVIEKFDGPYIASMKARLLAMSGRFDDARAIIKGLSHEKVGITIPTISIIERNWQRALDEANEILDSDILQAKAKFWIIVLKSRAYFELALRDVPRREDEDFTVPSSGFPEIHLADMKLAYETSLQAFKEAQRLNWPANTEYLVDVFVISSMILDRMESSLPLVSEFLYEKPYLTQTRELVSRLAIQFGNPRIALKLAELSKDYPKFENQDLMVIIANNAAGSTSLAFKLFNEEILTNSIKNETYYSSLLILALAADKSFQSGIVERIRSELAKSKLGISHLAILDCAIKVNHDQLKKIDALIELKDFWLKNDRPYQIALHILDNLYPLNPTEAKLAVEICELYVTTHCLPVEHSLVYSHALLTLRDHEKAIIFLESTSTRYPDNHEVKSLLGIALEINGQSERAFTLIQDLLQDGYATDNARQYFCNIALRMGYFDIAESQLRAALVSTSSRDVQISILQTLIRLLFSIEDRMDDIRNLSWEFGKLIDQDNEIQEGLFLQFYLMATSNIEDSISDAQKEEFQRRMRAFSTRFPKSNILWTAQLPEDGSPEELLNAINDAIGISKESLEHSEKIERSLDSGEFAVPFSWRPRFFLRNVGDIFTLWVNRPG